MMVQVKFIEGNRKRPPAGNDYRPHLMLKEGSEYLGVRFIHLPVISFDKAVICKVEALYPSVDYSSLKPGALFYIKEGGNVVGEGIVLEA